MIKYNKLFGILANRGIKKTDLVKEKIISSPTLAKLSKNEYVSIEVIDKLCQYLEVAPGEIMDAYKIVTYADENGKEYTKEIPTDQSKIDIMNELLNSEMMNGVLNLFKMQIGNDKAVDEAEDFLKKTINKENDTNSEI